MGGEGEEGGNMVPALGRHVHNMAREGGCGVVAAEMGACEPLRAGIPHWARLSFAEDLRCAKQLSEDYSDGPFLFVDPREF